MLCMLSMAFVATSCKDDKDDEPYIELKVSTDQIPLISDKNASASFTVTTSESWTITNDSPEWLLASPASGNGTGTVTLQTIKENNSSSSRTATLIVSTGNEETQKTVTVTQLPALAANCEVVFDNPLVLHNSVAMECKIGKDATTVYIGYLASDAAGWSNDKIVEALINNPNIDPMNPKDVNGIWGTDYLDAGKSYLCCAVAFNVEGEHGDLTKFEFKTPVFTDKSPYVTISNARYNNSYFTVQTTKNAFASTYLVMHADGENVATIINKSYAEVAWIMREAYKDGSTTPATNDYSNWNWPRTSNIDIFFAAAWAMDVNKNFSPAIEAKLYTVTENNKPVLRNLADKKGSSPKMTFTDRETINKLKSLVRTTK